MRLDFSKYQGTGNDFVMLNNMSGHYDELSLNQIQFICSRKIGVGADGLIKLSKHNGFDFEIEYFNADGSQSFCGNGARCAVAFAKSLHLIQDSAYFYAIDGGHKATISNGIVEIEMLSVVKFKSVNGDYILDTGSPHYVRIEESNDRLNIVEFGREIRYSEEFKEKGINVNLLSVKGENEIYVSTYERGVEDETLSCGTGVTACALVYMYRSDSVGNMPVIITTKGGVLKVRAKEYSKEKGFESIFLSGPAKNVFNGTIIV